MIIKFDEYYDKVKACFLGKNVGGTVGAPFEGVTGINNVDFYTHDLKKGVLPNDEAKELESHYNGLLEYPQYTRPEVFNGIDVPEVLKSGHHENIRKWRRSESLKNTYKKRKELLQDVELSDEDKKILEELK